MQDDRQIEIFGQIARKAEEVQHRKCVEGEEQDGSEDLRGGGLEVRVAEQK